MKKLSRILAIVLIAAAAMSLTGCATVDYVSAGRSFAAGDYEKAAEIYKSLGEYKDSVELSKESSYLAADEYAESGDNEAALELYEALEGYRDSAEKLAAAAEAVIRERIIGRWTSEEINAVQQLIESIGGGEFGKYIDIDKFAIYMEAEFNEDGSFTIRADKDRFMESINGIKDELWEGFERFMEAELSELDALGSLLDEKLAQYGVSSMDELLQAVLGMDIKTYFESFYNDETFEALAEAIKITGSYTVEDGRIILKVGTGSDEGVYELDTDTMTFKGDPKDETTQWLFPLVLGKAEPEELTETSAEK